MADFLSVRGAKTHNLKNIDVDIPRNKLTVITGLSGSGKSSLAFDTIYAEGQRRYVESLSAYARQFLGVMDKPDVDSITGLSPAISIDQKTASRNPRSTVGTVTEIYDYLRLLFAKIGVPHSPATGLPITRQTASQIVDRIAELPEGKRILLLAPLVEDKKGEHAAVIDKIKKDGFVRYRVDGTIVTITEEQSLDPKKKHTIEVVVDRLQTGRFGRITQTLKNGTEVEEPNPERTRLSDSVELTLRTGGGVMKVVNADDPTETYTFSERFACPVSGFSLPELSPKLFSFNNPAGACPTCHGIGNVISVDEKSIIPSGKLSIEEGAIAPWSTTGMDGWYTNILEEVAKRYKFKLSTPWGKLPQSIKDLILFGAGDETFDVPFHGSKITGEYSTRFEGVVANIERRYRDTESEWMKNKLEHYMTEKVCPDCKGARLRSEILTVKIGGKNIMEVVDMNVAEAEHFFKTLTLTKTETHIARLILKEILSRLSFLENVGLAYLTLSRAANTLSGGEAQRIRLATQIGSQLEGVLYVLDEPSIGLHQKDNDRLIETLTHLRDLGNTVLVVEHDEDIMRQADYLIDIGPGAGKHGGQVIAAGTPKELMKDSSSITGAYLSGKKAIPIPKERRPGNGKKLRIKGATEHNLQHVTVDIPLGCFIGVSGVSGSGKSSLINSILAKKLAHVLNGAKDTSGAHEEILGIEHLDKAIIIDQSPIGRTPKSNPATYTGVFTDIRDLFAGMPEAKVRGYKTGRFSFNVKGGRCESCQGEGVQKIEMHFLPDVYVPCEACNGKRYNAETLEVTFKGKSIADILDLTTEEALDTFSAQPSIRNKMQTLVDVGLQYVHLGQSATQLSGGEAQRIKLATELSRRATGKTLYILDEPTTGLHFDDVARLIAVLERLVEGGNTVIVIEHNLDVLKSCDHLLDLGPSGGSGGGRIVAQGTPEEVAATKESATGHYLKKILSA